MAWQRESVWLHEDEPIMPGEWWPAALRGIGWKPLRNGAIDKRLPILDAPTGTVRGHRVYVGPWVPNHPRAIAAAMLMGLNGGTRRTVTRALYQKLRSQTEAVGR